MHPSLQRGCLLGRMCFGDHVEERLGDAAVYGAGLARLELKLWIEEALRRFPDLTLDGQPTRVSSIFLNQYRTIPVRLTG